jgi:DNA polymerase I
MISDWRHLPFQELWCEDFEYYPGLGLNNGGIEGDASTPLCLVALEMRTGRIVRQWQDELGPFPPYRLDNDALHFGYMMSAELGCHIALGWGQPACALDPYIEFRHLTNDGTIESGDREKGFYSLAGALHYFGDDGVDTAHKTDMRERILQGPPFTTAERKAILRYCEDDTRALARLVAHIVPMIRSLPHAMFRAKYMWPIAHHERRGIQLDQPKLTHIRSHWNGIKADLVAEKNEPFGVYEIVEGVPHWRKHLFASYVHRNRMAWPTLPSGVFDESDEAFKTMEGRYPQVRELRQLRYSLSKLKLHELQVGRDGRNRCAPLGAYGTKTSRNAPSNAKFIFGPAKWLRFLIVPPRGRALIHRDFSQQEVHVAAVVSDDAALLEACRTGDVYLGVAKQLGLAAEDATKKTHPAVRQLFKTVVLGILYGLGPHTLSLQTGVSLFEAAELLARLRARFRTFENFVLSALDHAGLQLEIGTPFGWTMQCPPTINPRTVRNFPVQSTAAETLHVACILAERACRWAAHNRAAQGSMRRTWRGSARRPFRRRDPDESQPSSRNVAPVNRSSLSASRVAARITTLEQINWHHRNAKFYERPGKRSTPLFNWRVELWICGALGSEEISRCPTNNFRNVHHNSCQADEYADNLAQTELLLPKCDHYE